MTKTNNMDLQKIAEQAIPIYDKDCPSGRCEKDCRLSVDYKQRARSRLIAQIQAYAAEQVNQSYTQRVSSEMVKK